MCIAKTSDRSGRHRATSNGAAQLSEIVELKLMENAEEIAKAVLAGALKGTPGSVTLMVKIAECAGWFNEPEVVRSVVSLAKTLAEEPEFTGPSSGESGESGGGSREPEG